MIFRLAQDNDISTEILINYKLFHLSIEIQLTFFQMVCPCCFSFFIPGQNCIQKYYNPKRIRRIKQEKKTSSSIKHLIYLSQLTTIENSEFKFAKKIDNSCLWTTFKCKGCKTLIVHDTAPLEFSEHRPQPVKPTQSTAKSLPKKDHLQKILQKSQIPKAKESGKKDLDLESFLQGFL